MRTRRSLVLELSDYIFVVGNGSEAVCLPRPQRSRERPEASEVGRFTLSFPSQTTHDVCRALAYDLFADRVFRTPRMFTRLSAGIEEWIQWERENGYDFPYFLVVRRLMTASARWCTSFAQRSGHLSPTFELIPPISQRLRTRSSR